MPELRPRGNASLCIRCRKKFEPGDRVSPIYIVQKTGPNPENLREAGAWLTGEFELSHIDCTNPQLEMGSIIL